MPKNRQALYYSNKKKRKMANQNAPIQIHNNFQKFKADFKSDTGFNAEEKMDLYIQYFNARVNDYSAQVLHGLTHELLNKINFLPDTMALRIGEMINQSHAIKQLTQKLS